MSTEHTPLPWKHIRQSDGSHDIVAPRDTGAVLVATCGRQRCNDGLIAGNADLIVRGCNGHAELVEALERLLGDHQCDCGECAYCAGRAAIAKATGGAS